MYEIEPTPGNQVTTTRSLLDLSTEVLIQIFVYLPAADMIAVQHTCRTTRDIVTGTVYLQYALHAKINGVDDLLPPDFPYSERLELLRCHEQSWRDLQFHRFAEYPDTSCSGVPNRATIALQDSYLVYDCPTGRSGQQYGYADLCSAYQNKELRWVHLTMGKSQFPGLTRVVFAVDHDLVMAVRFCILLNSSSECEPNKRVIAFSKHLAIMPPWSSWRSLNSPRAHLIHFHRHTLCHSHFLNFPKRLYMQKSCVITSWYR